MARSRARGLTEARLRLLLGVLFLALALPSALLFWQTQRQIRLEAWHHQRQLAEELTQRIDAGLQRLISAEEARGFAEYRFLTVAGEAGENILAQRSPLATLPREAELPGLLGHFEVDAEGVFSTPLMPEPADEPARYGMSEVEWRERLALRETLLAVLSRNRLLARGPLQEEARREVARSRMEADAAPGPAKAQAAFDRLNQKASAPAASNQDVLAGAVSRERPATPGRSTEADVVAEESRSRPTRREQAVLLEAMPIAAVGKEKRSAPRISIFESAIDPLEFSRLDSGHLVLFRRVWRDGSRIIQGLILAPDAFLGATILRHFSDSPLAAIGQLQIAYRGEPLNPATGQAQPEGGAALELLHQHRLAAPLGDLQLGLALHELPAGPGARIASWTGIVLLIVLLTAFIVLYRLGLGQLRLARQQRDFVAAVSHELKTPLTSIRMYGELLREGWVSEEKRQEYYAYIHDESERLSRLISNVLQLARLERQELALESRPVAVGELYDLLRSRLAGQIERAGFVASFSLDSGAAGQWVEVDMDALLQILINLVDNALKFSARAALKQVEIAVRPDGDRHLVFSVRDHGPGVPRAQMRRIFELFYRPGSELSRETVGTGIGLALVQQLAVAMGGSVDVVNRDPGAEFRLRLSLSAQGSGPGRSPQTPDLS
jgi:two-component system, OmpR family, phosphate regulon sensor histidine kinase PhoR